MNVKNEEDKAILAALESSPFQSGLKLLTTAQPAIAPFTEITLRVVKLLAQRHENLAVHKGGYKNHYTNISLTEILTSGNTRMDKF